MLDKIKDFLYYISDLLFGAAVIAMVLAIFWYNVGGFFVDNLPEDIGRRIPFATKRVDSQQITMAKLEDDKKISDDKNIKNKKDDAEKSPTTDDKKNPDEKMPDNENPASLVDGEGSTLFSGNPSTDTDVTYNFSSTTADAATDDKPSDTPPNEVTISIPSGSNSEAVAQILADKGMVDDKDGFIYYLVGSGLDTKIMAGDFVIKRGMSYEEIALAITANR